MIYQKHRYVHFIDIVPPETASKIINELKRQNHNIPLNDTDNTIIGTESNIINEADVDKNIHSLNLNSLSDLKKVQKFFGLKSLKDAIELSTRITFALSEQLRDKKKMLLKSKDGTYYEFKILG